MAEINFCSAFSTSVIAGLSFETTRTFDIKFVPNNVVGAFFPSSFLLANIAGTAWSDKAKTSQRISQKVDLWFSPFWKLRSFNTRKIRFAKRGHEIPGIGLRFFQECINHFLIRLHPRKPRPETVPNLAQNEPVIIGAASNLGMAHSLAGVPCPVFGKPCQEDS